MKDKLETKKVKCFHKGCKEVVEVGLYEDEMQYCTKHEKKLYEAFKTIFETVRKKPPSLSI